MLRHSSAVRTFCLLCVASMVGCAASAAINPNQNTPEKTRATQLAAYAGNARFPRDLEIKKNLPAAAIVSRDKGTLKIYNFSGDPLRDVRIWVNGAYVQRVDGIAPQTSVVLHTNELYNALGQTLAGQNESVSRVQLETRENLYDLWGPAAE